MTNEQEMRRELLLIALERCDDPGKALELAEEMEGFIKNDCLAERTLDTEPRQAAPSAQNQAAKSPTQCRSAYEVDLGGHQLWAEGLAKQKLAEQLQRTPAGISSIGVILKRKRRKLQPPKRQSPQETPSPAIANRSQSAPKDPKPNGQGQSWKPRSN